MDGLLLAPVDRSAIYFGKAISNLAFMLVVEAIVLPVYSLLYNVNLFRIDLLGVILLGSIGYTAVGTLLSTMSAQTRTREILLPILFISSCNTRSAGSRQSQQRLIAGAKFSEVLTPLNILLCMT